VLEPGEIGGSPGDREIERWIGEDEKRSAR